MSKLLDIYLEPAKVFAELKDKPSFWLPLVLLITANIAMAAVYFSNADIGWFIDQQMLASGRDMSTAELEQARAFMPGPRGMVISVALTSTIFFCIIFCIYAAYYLVAGKITGLELRFKQALALATWGSMPMLLTTLIGLLGAFSMSPQTTMESLRLTHLDPLLLQLPLDHAWSSFAKGFDLLMLWSIALVALGWRQWGRGGWGGALIVAALPAVMIFGGWALFLAMK